MKRKGIAPMLVCVAVLAVLFAGCTGTTQTPSADTGTKASYIVGIDAEYPNFTFIDKDGNAVGFDVESAKWIAEKQGFDVTFQPVAWDSIIPALQAGKIDMVYAGMTITDERKEKVNFSIPYWTINQDVAAREGSSTTLDDVLAGNAVIGTQRGCTAAIWVEDNLIEAGKMSAENLKQYDNTPLAVNDLETGRIDAVMYDDLVLKDIISGKPVKIIGSVETNEQFGIAVRKDDTELLDELNAGLEKLMNDPYWEELKEKYNMA
jgi:polar amino acid transport system substrate-binding protein